MSKFLDKFRTNLKSKKSLAAVDAVEFKQFHKFLIENSAWANTLRETIITAAKARSNLKTKTKLFWDKIMLKYKLDPSKFYYIDLQTGAIILSKDQPVKKEVKNG